ncbi:hypothetical protein KQ51_00551 [Candidatus Izimaplasma bacterium HR1]|jgi:hypothetical protein|uniref:hypothetical protein n=1 Tax=Candidatus Izimoplasma sp. HR1 TaxID=1541959 RepID=UPI0004F63E3B|nr:hypothetical protein KQ51_00551 [Candidatus Izimaplasma bacterium HR1]
MKKTVFLLLFLLFLTTNTSVNGASTSLNYEFEEYEFRLSTISHSERGTGYHITKLGENSFETDAVYLNQKIRVTNVVEINEKHVFYGYTHNYEGDNYYDSFILILDKEGNEEFVLLEDYGELEEVRQVVEIDNVLLIRIEQNVENDMGNIVFYNNIFVTFDFEYNELNIQTIDEPIVRTANTDMLYLFDYDYAENFDGALTSDLEFLYDDTLDIPANEIYTDTVTILFLNEALLNEQVVYHGVKIEYPGNYELLYNDFTYVFVVEPVITGVEDNQVYTESVTPVISNGKYYLNNDLYVSGTEITEPGNYSLTITGVNEYEKVINFSINSSVTGIINNQTYDDDVEIEFEGEGYLNNTYIQSPYTISDEGEYLLKIRGEGDYLETYYFSVDKPVDEPTVIDYVQKYDIVFLGVVVIVGGIILKKK